MLNMGWSAGDLNEFLSLIVTHHQRNVVIQMTDLNHKYLSTLSDVLIDGQVDIDTEAEVTRKLSCTLFDPRHELGLDAVMMHHGALFADRMFRVLYRVGRPDGSKWFEVPIFHGPITKVNRKGPYLSVEGSGKEFFLFSAAYLMGNYRKGQYRTNVVIDLLRDGGESKYYVPRSTSKLTADIPISDTTPRWPQIEAQATALGRNVFFDARGTCQFRGYSSKSSYSFEKFTSEPEIGYNLDNLINTVVVVGARPKGAKVSMTRRFVASSTHPLSPYQLGRNVSGVRKRRYYTRVISNARLNTWRKIYDTGNRALRSGLMEGIEAAFDAPVNPLLEEGDAYTLLFEGSSTTARFKKSSIPLVGAPVASVGYLRNVNPQKTKIRRKIA